MAGTKVVWTAELLGMKVLSLVVLLDLKLAELSEIITVDRMVALTVAMWGCLALRSDVPKVERVKVMAE